MPTYVRKILCSDPESGRVIRCNSDGTGWEEWGHYIGGEITVGGTNVWTWDSYLDVAFDEDNQISYFASDGKGVAVLDLVADTFTVWNVAGGQLRNDACYFLLLDKLNNRLIVGHQTNGISIVNITTGIQIANHAAVGAVCGNVAMNNAGSEIVVWDGGDAADTPDKINLTTGAVTTWNWGAMPHSGAVYTDDCDFSNDDATLYVEMHSTGIPGGGKQLQHVLVTPGTMTPASWVWIRDDGGSPLYANVAVVDASKGYYAHAYMKSASRCALDIYRLSDNALMGTYDEATIPVFGFKQAINWRTYGLRKGIRGGDSLYHFQYYYYGGSTENNSTVYLIADDLSLTRRYGWKSYIPNEGFADNKDGGDAHPQYETRRVADGNEQMYQKKFHETDNYYMTSNVQPGSYSQTPRIFLKTWPWARPRGLYRDTGSGAIYVYDAVDTVGTSNVSRLVKYSNWKTGSRLTSGFRTKLDQEGNYTTGWFLGMVQSSDRVCYSSSRPGHFICWMDDFLFDDATDTDIAAYLTATFPTMFRVEPATGKLYYSVQGDENIARYTAAEAYEGVQDYQPAVGAKTFYDVWIDPDDGKHYYATSVGLVRSDAWAPTNAVTYGANGAGQDQFSNPRGITGDSTYLYIADTGNSRIVRIDKAPFDGTGWLTIGTRGFSGSLKLVSPFHMDTMLVTIPDPTPGGVSEQQQGWESRVTYSRSSADHLVLRFSSEGLRYTRPVQSMPIGQRHQSMHVFDKRSNVEGSIMFEWRLAYLGTLIKNALYAKVTTTGSDPYNHLLRAKDYRPTSLTLEKYLGTLGRYFTYNECQISSLTLNCPAEGIVTGAVGFIGREEVISASPSDATPISGTDDPLVAWQGSVEVDGAVNLHCRSITIESMNTLRIMGVDTISGKPRSADIAFINRKIAGSLSLALHLEDLPYYEAFKAGSPTSLQLRLASDSYYMDIWLHNIELTGETPMIDKNEPIDLVCPFMALESTIYRTPMTVELVNGESVI